jgi:hypothetical protein
MIYEDQKKHRNAKEVDQAMKFNKAQEQTRKGPAAKCLKLKHGKTVTIIFPYGVIHEDGVHSRVAKKKKIFVACEI